MFVRPLSAEERDQLQAGIRSTNGFVLRRCQVILASSQGQTPSQIAPRVGRTPQGVRNVIHSFNQQGLACLEQKSNRPQRLRTIMDEASLEGLRELLHQSPRAFDKPTSLWTLELAAQVSFEQGLTPYQVSTETIRQALQRLGKNWRRAKHWISSPDPEYQRKRARDRLVRQAESHPDCVVGFLDETWWSRLAQPSLHSWAEGDQPLRLLEKHRDKQDPDPVALACYGLMREDCHRVLLRFVVGRPVSEMTIGFLDWVCKELEREGKKALLLVWDNASWHISQRVQGWLRKHNITAKQEGGVRIISCLLPVKSPWLNPIEPCWIHGKRAILEPERKLTAGETQERVCRHFGCPHLQPLTLAKEVA